MQNGKQLISQLKFLNAFLKAMRYNLYLIHEVPSQTSELQNGLGVTEQCLFPTSLSTL